MATFLQNLAPGMGSLAGGYLKGEAATQEKYRQEELTRQKDAMTTYMELIKSGHFRAVDPEKGAKTPGVLSIGGIGFLEPVEVKPWEKAEYDLKREQMEHDKWKMGKERELQDAKEEGLIGEREFRLKMQGLQVEEQRARTRAAEIAATTPKKGEKPKETTFTDMRDGMSVELTDEDYDRIMSSHPTKLTKEELKIREASEKGALVRGKPTTITEKPAPVYKGIDPNSLEAQKQVVELFKQASQPKLTEEGGRQIASQLNNMILDQSTRYYTWEKSWYGKGGVAGLELPVVDTVGGGKRQMLMGDIRKKARETGRTIEEVINAIKQRMGAK